MADADAVRGAGLPDRLTTTPTPGQPAPGQPAPGQPMAAEPEKVMSLVDHLSELRNRIVKSIAAVIVGTLIGFTQVTPVRDLLISPLPDDHEVLQVLGPGDAFTIALKIALVLGVILAMPVLLYQLWAFVSPGLTPSERRALRPWIPLALFFFLLGVTIAWIILPYAILFLLSFTDDKLVANLAAPGYFDFVTTLFLAFGLLMEFPIVLYALARVGIVSSARLRASRRFIFLGTWIFAAVATPGGDLVSPTILALTMYTLFELTLLAIKRSGR
jgi:sec-independent protein translocase protein TatC